MMDIDEDGSHLPISRLPSNHSPTPRQQLHPDSNDEDTEDGDHDNDVDLNETPLQSEHNLLVVPLLMAQEDSLIESGSIRSRNNGSVNESNSTKQKRLKDSKRKKRKQSSASSSKLAKKDTASSRRWCCSSCPAPFVRSTLSVMNFLARVLFWCTVVATVAAIGWYSYELKNNGYARLLCYSKLTTVAPL